MNKSLITLIAAGSLLAGGVLAQTTLSPEQSRVYQYIQQMQDDMRRAQAINAQNAVNDSINIPRPLSVVRYTRPATPKPPTTRSIVPNWLRGLFTKPAPVTPPPPTDTFVYEGDNRIPPKPGPRLDPTRFYKPPTASMRDVSACMGREPGREGVVIANDFSYCMTMYAAQRYGEDRPEETYETCIYLNLGDAYCRNHSGYTGDADPFKFSQPDGKGFDIAPFPYKPYKPADSGLGPRAGAER